jgi:hypothetical protein
MKNIPIKKILLVFALLIGLVIPLRSASAADARVLPAFSDFLVEVMNGQAKVVRGVYVPGTLALRVEQQPPDDPETVLRQDGVATQFRLAAENHIIGLLAHNYLAGTTYSSLTVGQEVRIVYGDGRVDYYMVNRLARFQALQFGSQNEHYVDLSSKISYTPQYIFTMFYDGDTHVTFQTCIYQDGNSSWGRLFVTAIPVPAHYLREFLGFRILISMDNAGADSALKLLLWDSGFR